MGLAYHRVSFLTLGTRRKNIFLSQAVISSETQAQEPARRLKRQRRMVFGAEVDFETAFGSLLLKPLCPCGKRMKVFLFGRAARHASSHASLQGEPFIWNQRQQFSWETDKMFHFSPTNSYEMFSLLRKSSHPICTPDCTHFECMAYFQWMEIPSFGFFAYEQPSSQLYNFTLGQVFEEWNGRPCYCANQ